jgi:hypothetical protein
LTIAGVWVPNWQFDVYCMADPIADEAVRRFGLGVRPVVSPTGHELGAQQVIVEPSSSPWFDEKDLRRIITPIHGQASESCRECGVTRWLPVGMDVLPLPNASILGSDPTVIASREWFGAGMRSFHQILWRRDVADFLVSSSPRDMKIQEVGGQP